MTDAYMDTHTTHVVSWLITSPVTWQGVGLNPAYVAKNFSLTPLNKGMEVSDVWKPYP